MRRDNPERRNSAEDVSYVAWCGAAWPGVVWHDVVWCGAVWCDVVSAPLLSRCGSLVY